MYKNIYLLCLSIVVIFSSCVQTDPNIDRRGEDELKALEIDRSITDLEQDFQDIIYVPIYSDVYVDEQNQKILLAATLSIRNTSFEDSIFISKIDYYNTEGNLVRSYIDNIISLPPMATVNYVIDKEDDSGGPGANFIVELSSKSREVMPIIQAVMIGHTSNRAWSFVTDGYSILKQ